MTEDLPYPVRAHQRQLRFMKLYGIGCLGTFAYLTFFDGYAYNAWNWLIAVPVNWLLGMIWPIYWTVLRWIF